MAKDLALAGIQQPSPQSSQEEHFEVWEENLESFTWFARMDLRWIFNQRNGKRIRLDDRAVLAQLKTFGVKKSKRKIIMDDLLAMETAALEVWRNE